MDEELFGLCKEVYERTKWDGNKQFAFDKTYADRWLRYIADFPHDTREWKLNMMVPLYTSDYILDKLPEVILERDPDLFDEVYGAHVGLISVMSDTPLKALLKLVIALDNANQLPHEEKE